MSGTLIRQCECGDFIGAGAAFQNAKYGYGRRVFNKGAAVGKKAGCTVCGKVIQLTDAAAKTKAAPADKTAKAGKAAPADKKKK